MADLKRLLLGSTLIQRFIEYFSTAFSPPAGETWYTNAFNNWNWFSSGTFNAGYANVSNGVYTCGAQGNGNAAYANIYRSKENYNIGKSYDISYSFTIERFSGGFPFVSRLSIGGNAVTSDTNMGGLEFRLDRGNTNNFAIYNNGTLLAVPYSGLNVGTYFIFIKKRGLQISVTLNTTGTPPTNYDYTYTMTDTTVNNNCLLFFIYAHGFGESGWTSGNVDNINVLAIG